MSIAIDTESHAELQRQLAQADAGGQHMAAEIERLTNALMASESLKRGYLEENVRFRAATQDACDLLAERKHGNAARSPGHNARLILESALNPQRPGSALWSGGEILSKDDLNQQRPIPTEKT